MTKATVGAAGEGLVPTLVLALLLGLMAGPAPAAETSGDGSDSAGHDMGGNDSKPGFFDIGKSGTSDAKAPLPAPGKAAGASAPNSPPPPTR